MQPTTPSMVQVLQILHYYGFDLGGQEPAHWWYEWNHEHPEPWVGLAVLEALYQGRYKAISVSQILRFWQRRSLVTVHFNEEFSRLMCHALPAMPEETPAAENILPEAIPHLEPAPMPSRLNRRLERLVRQQICDLEVTKPPRTKKVPIAPETTESGDPAVLRIVDAS